MHFNLIPEYAISTDRQILLFDSNWTKLDLTITQEDLRSIKTITYDAVHDVFYLADKKQPKIFSLQVKDGKSFIIDKFADISKNQSIQDLVYDFHDDALYWSTSNRRIMKLTQQKKDKNIKMIEEVFLDVGEEVSGLEIDTCGRNLYFTTTSGDNPSVNVIPLDKSTLPRSFSHKDHTKPVAISLDHQSRRLYVADVKEYRSYSIDSYGSNGFDFRNEISNGGKLPRSITVDKNSVYYVEGDQHSLNRFMKDQSGKKTSEVMQKLPSDPSDIIVRSNFIVDHDLKNCEVSAKRMSKVKEEIKKTETQSIAITKNCLHGGSLDVKSSSCICKEDFDGEFCEINLCYNFCLNGVCTVERSSLTQKLAPHCSCESGYEGKRCEIDVCNKFCLNNGKCYMTNRKEPACHCKSDFTGSRCELMKVNYDTSSTTVTILESNNSSTTTSLPIVFPFEKSVDDLPPNCPEDNDKKNNRIFLYIGIAGLVGSTLIIFVLTLLLWKRRALPRPKPHKKYVIHKKIDNLTYRPTTEQCEVVIEDCCNMNICETVS